MITAYGIVMFLNRRWTAKTPKSLNIIYIQDNKTLIIVFQLTLMSQWLFVTPILYAGNHRLYLKH